MMLTVYQVADRVGVPPRAIYAWHQTRQFPQSRVDPTPGASHKMLWDSSDVDAWLESPQAKAKLADHARRAEGWQKRLRNSTTEATRAKANNLEASL